MSWSAEEVDRIVLLDGNEVIASHLRLTGRQHYSLDITHYIKTFHRKPGALPNSRVLAQVDELILDLFNRYYLDDLKGFLSILDLMLETSTEALSHALIILNEQNISPTSARWKRCSSRIESPHIPHGTKECHSYRKFRNRKDAYGDRNRNTCV
jgi:hypothetical protein